MSLWVLSGLIGHYSVCSVKSKYQSGSICVGWSDLPCTYIADSLETMRCVVLLGTHALIWRMAWSIYGFSVRVALQIVCVRL